MQTRSVALVEAALVGYAFVIGVMAFVRWWGLIIQDTWMPPLLTAMFIQFLAECLLANKLGSFGWTFVSGALTVKALLILAVAMGFTAQRMALDTPGSVILWGHWTAAAAILYEIYRFLRVLKAFDISLGPLEAIVSWLERMIGGAVREASLRSERVGGAKDERKAARAEYWDTGEVKSQPAINTISGEMPAVKIDSDEIPKPTDAEKDGTGEV